jgi:disulfide bond formation protein DsbB
MFKSLSLASPVEHKFSYSLNLLALLGISVSLLIAFFYQIAFNEIPCPLCQLQRLGLILVGMGFMLNAQFGPSTVHYAMAIMAALAGAATSLRQILLHIAPGDTGYGSALYGMHFYTWGFISFVMVIVFTALMLWVDRKNFSAPRQQRLGLVAVLIISLFLILSLANTVSSVMVCKLGPCPDNPIKYLLSF